MKSVPAQLLDRTDFQFGHQHSKTTLFVPITGTNGTTMIHALCQQLPPDTRCVCHRLIVSLTDYKLIISDDTM